MGSSKFVCNYCELRYMLSCLHTQALMLLWICALQTQKFCCAWFLSKKFKMYAAFVSVYGALLSKFSRGDNFRLACTAMRTKSSLAISHIWWLSDFPQTCFWHHTFQTLFLIHYPCMSNVRHCGTHSHNVTLGSAPSTSWGRVAWHRAEGLGVLQGTIMTPRWPEIN